MYFLIETRFHKGNLLFSSCWVAWVALCSQFCSCSDRSISLGYEVKFKLSGSLNLNFTGLETEISSCFIIIIQRNWNRWLINTINMVDFMHQGWKKNQNVKTQKNKLCVVHRQVSLTCRVTEKSNKTWISKFIRATY